MSTRFVLNQPVVLTATFTVASVVTDPTTISLTVTDPAGTATTYTYAGATITKTSTGVYTKTVTGNLAGVWSYVWTGTGTAADVQDGTFTIYDDVPVDFYCQLDELKSRLKITDTNDDVELEGAIGSVSGWIDGWCEDYFGRVTATRTFRPCDRFTVEPGSLVSITTLKTDADHDGTFETTWTANTDYQLLPYNPNTGRETKPYSRIIAVGSLVFPLTYTYRPQRTDLVQIAGVFGWPAIPPAVHEAALILAEETVKLKDAPFGVAGFDQFGAVRIKDNPKALNLLAPYRRVPVAFA